MVLKTGPIKELKKKKKGFGSPFLPVETAVNTVEMPFLRFLPDRIRVRFPIVQATTVQFLKLYHSCLES